MITLIPALAALIILILFGRSSFIGLKFYRLKKKIKNNPLIGTQQQDGSYCYKEGDFSVGYKIRQDGPQPEDVEWVFSRRRVARPEEELRRFFEKVFLYQRWTALFRPPVVFLLLASAVIFYFGFLQSQNERIEGLKWIVAAAAGVDSSQVQYIGDGWLQITGRRKTSWEGISEPIRYTFNPFRSLFYQDGGFLTRWRGKTFGYVTYPVAFNNRGDVWFQKEGAWRHGRFTKYNTVEWDVAQGTGKVSGHTISTQDKKLYIIPNK